MFRLLPFAAFVLCLSADFLHLPDTGVTFIMRQQKTLLEHPMRGGTGPFFPRDGFTEEELDTLSNWFSSERQYVEFVRQDHPIYPTLGFAMGFEFDEHNGEYPYIPAHARLQIKDFGWGGLEFSPRDTCNYTGVNNQVSDDFSMEIDSFINDTIYGRFNGLLINGAGKMMPVDSGHFKVGLYRVD